MFQQRNVQHLGHQSLEALKYPQVHLLACMAQQAHGSMPVVSILARKKTWWCGSRNKKNMSELFGKDKWDIGSWLYHDKSRTCYTKRNKKESPEVSRDFPVCSSRADTTVLMLITSLKFLGTRWRRSNALCHLDVGGVLKAGCVRIYVQCYICHANMDKLYSIVHIFFNYLYKFAIIYICNHMYMYICMFQRPCLCTDPFWGRSHHFVKTLRSTTTALKHRVVTWRQLKDDNRVLVETVQESLLWFWNVFWNCSKSIGMFFGMLLECFLTWNQFGSKIRTAASLNHGALLGGQLMASGRTRHAAVCNLGWSSWYFTGMQLYIHSVPFLVDHNLQMELQNVETGLSFSTIVWKPLPNQRLECSLLWPWEPESKQTSLAATTHH